MSVQGSDRFAPRVVLQRAQITLEVTPSDTLLEFSTHGVRSMWSRQVLTALREAHPEVFTDVTEDVAP